MGIARDSWHKRRATGGRRPEPHKKRKFELGRPSAQTKMGPKRIHVVRTRGGHTKLRALRLESGNFQWASEGVTRKTRIIDVVYNASNNELVRTKTLVKNAIVQVDATPFRQWFEAHYAVGLGRKKGKNEESTEASKTRSKHLKRVVDTRKSGSKVDTKIDEQFSAGRVYAKITSRPGQAGRADGVVLEGKELEFYLKKLKSKKEGTKSTTPGMSMVKITRRKRNSLPGKRRRAKAKPTNVFEMTTPTRLSTTRRSVFSVACRLSWFGVGLGC